MTSIAVCGANGKMGKVVSKIISSKENCKVIAGIDVFTEKYADFDVYNSPFDMPIKPDVIIDFSNPDSLENLLSYAKMNNVPLVLATTGYKSEQVEEIKSASTQIPIFFTFNMSLGINLLIEFAKKATAILSDDFDIEIIEKHHNQKVDAPSGTAIMIADAINKEADNKYHYVYDRHSYRQKRDKAEIGIHTLRGGTIVGEHDIVFAGNDEVITLSHSASSKEVFAVGAVNAALFLCGKPSGLYEMKNLIQF